MHNALKQVKLELASYTVQGFSISGLATYIQIPELDSCFDIGECPLSALPLNHIFLTHAHGDHSRCLMRHYSLRNMLGLEKNAHYYLPEFLIENARGWIKAEAKFEGVPDDRVHYPTFVPMIPGEKVQLAHRKDLYVEPFKVKHSQPSLGYTIFYHKKKLKPEYLELPGTEIAKLRMDGVEITNEVYQPRVTFIGDCIAESISDSPSILDSHILILETTFIDSSDVEMASRKGHTHLYELLSILEANKELCKFDHLILKHFSMKYSYERIRKQVQRKLPDWLADKVIVLL